MRNLCVSILTGFILSLTGTSAAAEFGFNKTLDFSPGGQTIGGPGITELDADRLKVVWNSFALAGARVPVAACLTVANVGKFVLQIDSNDRDTRLGVPPGEVLTQCHPDVYRFALACSEGIEVTPREAKCQALWRVDEYHPPAKPGQ